MGSGSYLNLPCADMSDLSEPGRSMMTANVSSGIQYPFETSVHMLDAFQVRNSELRHCHGQKRKIDNRRGTPFPYVVVKLGIITCRSCVSGGAYSADCQHLTTCTSCSRYLRRPPSSSYERATC